MAKSKLEQRVTDLEDELRLTQYFLFRELLNARFMMGKPVCVRCAEGWAEVLGIDDAFAEGLRDRVVEIHHSEGVDAGNC
jgi:hypothetical protein